MKKIINKYLRKYIIVHNQFYVKKEDKSYYGWQVLEELDKIFGISEDESKLILINWLRRRKYNNLESFNINKPTPNVKSERIFQPVPFEPKRRNRWMVVFPEDYNIPTYCLRNTSRPSLNIINGGQEWDDMFMEFNDPIGPSVTQAIMNLTYPPILGEINFLLEMLGPVGDTVERWEISGIINRVDFGELSYDNPETMTVNMNISLTNVTLLF
jgi:hypothetical protein